MYGFAFPYAFLLLSLIAGVLIWGKRRRTRRAFLYSDETLLAPVPRWVRVFLAAANALLVAALMIAVVAIARPLGAITEIRTFLEVRRGCLAMDISGSMGELDKISGVKKIQAVLDAAKRFVAARKGDAFCVVPFETAARIDMALPLTTDDGVITRALDHLVDRVGGATALSDGLFYALAFILDDTLPPEQRLDVASLHKEATTVPEQGALRALPLVGQLAQQVGKLLDCYVTVFTDAEWTTGVDPVLVLEVIERFGCRVYIIGVGFSYETYPQLVSAVSRTGGKVLFAHDTSDLEQLLTDIDKLETRRELTDVVRVPKELAPYAALLGACLCTVAFLIRLWLGLYMPGKRASQPVA